MKKIKALILCLAAALALTACAGPENTFPESTLPQLPVSSLSPEESEAASPPESNPEPDETSGPDNGSTLSSTDSTNTESNVLIVYFTWPEDVDTSGVDALAGASVVVRDGVKLGSNEYVARIIQKTIGGDLFSIDVAEPYPLDHQPLVDQAADEKDKALRPELAAQVENLGQYDTIILGFPNWWADMPMPVYTFLESCDLSGKTIIPFVTHGSSRFSNTVSAIARLQPNAEISENTLCIARNDVASSEEDVIAWAEGLGLN